MQTKKIYASLGALAIAASMLLSGCSDAGTQSGQSSSAAQSESQSSDAEVAPTVDRDPSGDLPEISFDADNVPSMKPVDANPPTVITVKNLKKGDGATITPDDVLTVNYSGFLWNGEAFDSSYERGETSTFSLNQVIQGWKWGLADAKVGDTLELIVPPEYGYGSTAQGSIPADSTLVFVVEIVDTVSIDTAILKDATPTEAKLPTGLDIKGELGESPSISFASDAAAPTKEETIVLADGSGPVVTDTDTVFYHLAGAYWGSTDVSSTWDSDVQQTVGATYLVGQKVGSRILIVAPASESSSATSDGTSAASVLVVDIIAAQPGTSSK